MEEDWDDEASKLGLDVSTDMSEPKPLPVVFTAPRRHYAPSDPEVLKLIHKLMSVIEPPKYTGPNPHSLIFETVKRKSDDCDTSTDDEDMPPLGTDEDEEMPSLSSEAEYHAQAAMKRAMCRPDFCITTLVVSPNSKKHKAVQEYPNAGMTEQECIARYESRVLPTFTSELRERLQSGTTSDLRVVPTVVLSVGSQDPIPEAISNRMQRSITIKPEHQHLLGLTSISNDPIPVPILERFERVVKN
jgi:hypothetical protein